MLITYCYLFYFGEQYCTNAKYPRQESLDIIDIPRKVSRDISHEVSRIVIFETFIGFICAINNINDS